MYFNSVNVLSDNTALSYYVTVLLPDCYGEAHVLKLFFHLIAVASLCLWQCLCLSSAAYRDIKNRILLYRHRALNILREHSVLRHVR